MTLALDPAPAHGTSWTRDELNTAELLDRLEKAAAVRVVITVYNGGASVERCLRSVLTHTTGAEIVVIDDASTDDDIIGLLDGLAAAQQIRLVRHAQNQGYTRTINHALELTGEDDLVLLNSDTEVGPMWLQRLRWVAYSRPDVASVTASSDNAGAMSLPEVGVHNSWGPHLSWSEVSRLVASHTRTWAQSMPTANGFCVYLRRDAIDEVGDFDVEAFPRGYGEENDWSMRAIEHGRVNLYAPHVFVRHVRSQSFGGEREKLAQAGRAAVDARHPSYTTSIRAWRSAPESQAMAAEAGSIQRTLGAMDDVRARRLYVLHRTGGGTPATNLDLIGELAEQQHAYLLESVGGRSVELHTVRSGKLEHLSSWAPETPYTVRDRWDDEYAVHLADIIITSHIEVIHVRHLIHTPIATLPEVARRLGVRLIYSTHDFHPVCPTITLLDENLEFCGGTCTPGGGRCTLPAPAAATMPGDLKNGWVHDWQATMSGVVDRAEAVVATTPSAGDVIRANYPNSAAKLHIIEHGRDVNSFEPARAAQRRIGPIRILAPAIWAPHKGIDYVRALAARLGPGVEWHFLGKGANQLSDVGVDHGEYDRGTLVRLTQAIDPDVVGLFSIWPETYSHTLTEAWAMGVPVIATDLGAFHDRVSALGGGVLLPLQVERAAAILEEQLVPEQLEALRLQVPRHAVRHPLSMANDYARLYQPSGSRLPRVGILDRGGSGQMPATAHIRAHRRALGARFANLINFERLVVDDYANGIAAGDLDVLLIVRDAVPPAVVDRVLERASREGTRVVVDLDDDLVTDHARARLSAQHWDVGPLVALERVLRAADHVIVSTAELRGLLEPLNPSLSVVPNALDPRLWSRDVASAKVPPRRDLRLLYMGSATHAEDLELLDGVVTRVSAELGRAVRLEVVGVTSGRGIEGMERVNPTRRDYPGFVTWLRANARRWDVGVAPLVSSPFNDHKSDLKLLEYAMLGLPVVGSATGPYVDASDLALLTANDQDAWVAALVATLSDLPAAKERAASALELVRAERMLDEASLATWVDALTGR